MYGPKGHCLKRYCLKRHILKRYGPKGCCLINVWPEKALPEKVLPEKAYPEKVGLKSHGLKRQWADRMKNTSNVSPLGHCLSIRTDICGVKTKVTNYYVWGANKF